MSQFSMREKPEIGLSDSSTIKILRSFIENSLGVEIGETNDDLFQIAVLYISMGIEHKNIVANKKLILPDPENGFIPVDSISDIKIKMAEVKKKLEDLKRFDAETMSNKDEMSGIRTKMVNRLLNLTFDCDGKNPLVLREINLLAKLIKDGI